MNTEIPPCFWEKIAHSSKPVISSGQLPDDFRIPFPLGLAGGDEVPNDDFIHPTPIVASAKRDVGNDIHLCLRTEPRSVAQWAVLDIDDPLAGLPTIF